MRIPPVVVVAVGLAVSRVLAGVDPLARPSAPLQALGAGLAVAGVAVALAGVRAFRRHQTTVDPRVPERAATLVADGPYRWTRNPMYVGMVAVAVGAAAWLGSPLSLAGPALVFAWLDRVQIPAEERALRARFGDGFARYSGRVARWAGRSRVEIEAKP